ncbi:MAG: glycine cleavage system protein GcvH [Fimbriimonadales bacterium]|nr:glycine cleavage system protein GcvH [Fimbriimonadales bacterium]
MFKVPDDLQYTKTHEWIRQEDDTFVIGITDYAQSELGDIVYVDLPEPGRYLNAGDTFGSVESVKTVSDLYAPVSGEVLEKNELLHQSPELINQDPYGEGWLIKVKAEGDPVNTLTQTSYKMFLEEMS